MDCLVKFDYTAQGPDELTIKEGDTISNAEEFGDSWFKGTLSGKTGLIPENHLKICTYSLGPCLLSRLEFVVFQDYVAKNWGDLTIHKGDVIVDVQNVSDGLYRGTLKHNAENMSSGWYTGTQLRKTGFFPTNFVKLCFSKVLPSDLASFQFEVHSDYLSETPDRLSLKRGNTISNVQYSSKGWIRGTLIGKTGIFPRNFVEIIGNSNDKALEIPDETVTQQVQRLTIREQDIPEELLCPVCLELPDKEIFQCRNGHALCATCKLSIQNCPQCRISLNVDGGLIRNRIAESLVCNLKSRTN